MAAMDLFAGFLAGGARRGDRGPDWAEAGRPSPVSRERESGPPGDRFFYDGVAAGRDVRAGLARRAAANRPLPLEELCFFVKPIDNSRLVRVVDPHSRRECLGLVVCVSAVFCLALLYVLPYLAILRTGYRTEEQKKEYEVLAANNRQLQIREAKLRDPRRIQSIARGLGLQVAAPQQVVWPEGGAPRTDAELLARYGADSIARR